MLFYINTLDSRLQDYPKRKKNDSTKMKNAVKLYNKMK